MRKSPISVDLRFHPWKPCQAVPSRAKRGIFKMAMNADQTFKSWHPRIVPGLATKGDCDAGLMLRCYVTLRCCNLQECLMFEERFRRFCGGVRNACVVVRADEFTVQTASLVWQFLSSTHSALYFWIMNHQELKVRITRIRIHRGIRASNVKWQEPEAD